ncbi:nitroreductase [Rhodoblastus sp.]|uniref:nitroreductase family protein n=1 Tax=Rhodoblastus sp. TaxID=1962975 RepID=UPI0035AE94A7
MTEPLKNDTLRLLSGRRSAPPIQMRGPGPDAQELRSILTLASRVPDHGKLTPWRFILFEGEGRQRAGDILAEIYARREPAADAQRLELERGRFARAPLVVGVVSRAAPHVKIPEWEQQLTAGAVCMALTVAATALGFRTAWLTEWCAYDREALTRFGLAEQEKIAGFIHIGRVENAPEDRPRPDVDALVTRF